MGEVWRCRDLELGGDVAVKAVRPELLCDPVAARLFHGEIVAVARLNHVSIVPVYDLVRETDGTTLLVMEYRPGTSLASFVRARPAWPFVRDVLLQVLEGLACAHARGVLHLDIKPENVVVELDGGTPFAPRRAVKTPPAGAARASPGSAATQRSTSLATSAASLPMRATILDFGVARIHKPGVGVERWLESNALVGTIEYMAPEQCGGGVERLGPWTDLYSVGVMAYELCAGRRPFADGDPVQAVISRLRTPAPRLVPRTSDVPAAFVELCADLLATEPQDRPLAAADVLDALRELSSARAFAPAGAEPAGEVEAEAATAAVARHELDTLVAESQPVLTEPAPSARRKASITADPSRVVLDERALDAAPAIPLAGAYGLFGLRDLPTLGRRAERRTMWAAVRAAVVEKRTHAVLLEGPAGVGKSRLASDVLERAVELGVCVAMQTSWSAQGSGDEGLRGLVENLLDTRGARGPAVRARLEFWLSRIPGDHESFIRDVELLLRPPAGAAPDAGLAMRVAVEAITLATSLRPVLVWLDDVHWSRGEAAALARGLRAHPARLPVCLLATAREEELDPRTLEALLGALPDQAPTSGDPPMSRVSRVRVDPLDLDATRRLVRGLLDVDDELCAALAVRAEGNPLFVTQLLRHLVGAEAFERVGGRYRLAGDVELTSVPADLAALWERRIQQSGADPLALTALAIVRERVSREVAGELGEVLARGAVDRPVDLEAALEAALSAGLLRLEGGAYVWAHGLLRAYLAHGAAPALAPRLHAAAAEALAPLVGREDVQEERARHLDLAGRAREACEAMLDAALWAFRRADAPSRRARLEALASWTARAGHVALEARARAELGHARAEVGEADAAAAEIARARAALGLDPGPGAALPADRALERLAAAAWVAFRHAQVARLAGRNDEGARASEEAGALARAVGEREVETLVLLQQGVDCARAGDAARGAALLEQAAELARSAGDRAGESQALRTLAHIAPAGEGLPLVERSIALAREAGATRLELVGKQVWAQLLWASGARDSARREARALAAEASRRSLRQTVSLLELQSAGWAAAEDDLPLVAEHRDTAARWGAASGAAAERVTLLALDLLLAIARADRGAALAAADDLARTRGGYDDPSLRDLLAKARSLAPPDLADLIAPA
jgi:hypothetical protein